MNRTLGLALAPILASVVTVAAGCGDSEPPSGSGGTSGAGGNPGSSTCGNGVVEDDVPPFETCDDGNTTSGDGCSNNCRIELLRYSGDVVMTGTQTITDVPTGQVINSRDVGCNGSLQVFMEGPTTHGIDASLSCSLVNLAEWNLREASRGGEGLSELDMTFNADFFPCQGEGVQLVGTLVYDRDADGNLTESRIEGGTFMKVCQREDPDIRERVEFTGTFEATTTQIREE